MNTAPAPLPPSNPVALAAFRAQFVAEILKRKAAGLSRVQFQADVWNWAVKKKLICDGHPWLTSERAGEAYDNPQVFAHDPMTHPQGLLTAMEMYGCTFTVQDHQMVVVTWMAQGHGR